MLRGTTVGELPDGRAIVEMDCGCQYVDAFAPMIACYDHRYMRCAKCGGWAEVSPIGMLCLHCTFGGAILAEKPARAL